jgi:hypothetical protein
MLGVLLNLILGLSRVLLAMGLRLDMPRVLARLNPSGTTPYVAVVAVEVAIALLILIRKMGLKPRPFRTALHFLPLPPWNCKSSVYLCIALSTGQLPFQILQPCTHSVLLLSSLPCGVMRCTEPFDYAQDKLRRMC